MKLELFTSPALPSSRSPPRRFHMLSEAAIRAFRAALRGPLLVPDAPGYEEARSIHNAMIDRRPALIARCAGVADVIAAVKFARANQIVASVKGTGHSVTGVSI